jgi:hypothetical protein
VGAMERGELLGRLDSLSKDALAAGYLLLITEVSALSTLVPSQLAGQRIEQAPVLQAEAPQEVKEVSVQAVRARAEELPGKQQVIETDFRVVALKKRH